MYTLTRCPRAPLGWSLVILTLVTVRAGHAQDDDVVQAPVPEAQPAQQFVLNDLTFDQWAFGNRTETAAEAELTARLAVRIDEVDRICVLTADQKQKLRLAGQGDIKRFFDRAEEKRRKYVNVAHDRARVTQIFQEIHPLQEAFQNEQFGEGTLFGKTLVRVLGDKQSATYERHVQARQQLHDRARIDAFVTMIDDALGMTDDQREQFTQLARAETHPPKRSGPYDYYIMMNQLSKIPEEKLKPLFDESQWRVMNQNLALAKGMEPFLRQNGYLSDGEGAGPVHRAVPRKEEVPAKSE